MFTFLTCCMQVSLRANVNPMDRWGGTPLSDAMREKHVDVRIEPVILFTSTITHRNCALPLGRELPHIFWRKIGF